MQPRGHIRVLLVLLQGPTVETRELPVDTGSLNTQTSDQLSSWKAMCSLSRPLAPKSYGSEVQYLIADRD